MISIIVPVYNVEKWLDCCIESIVNQTYKDIEIILVDDGSTDNSSVMCDEWAIKDSRIKVLHIANGGVSNARNLGVDKATGEWIMFLDSDDWLEIDACDKLMNIADENGADIVSGSFVYEYQSKSETYRLEMNEGELHKLDARELVSDILYTKDVAKKRQLVAFYVPWARIIRKQIIKDNNLKFALGIHPGEDTIFNIALFSKTTEHYFINIPVVHYRQVKGSAMNSKTKDYFLNAERSYYALNDYLHSCSDVRCEEFCLKFKCYIMNLCLHQCFKNLSYRCDYNLFKMVRVLKENLNKECYRVSFDENVAEEFGLIGRRTKFLIRAIIKKKYTLLALFLLAYEFKQKFKGRTAAEDFF